MATSSSSSSSAGALGGGSTAASPYKEVDDFVLTVVRKDGVQGCKVIGHRLCTEFGFTLLFTYLLEACEFREREHITSLLGGVRSRVNCFYFIYDFRIQVQV